MPRDARADVFLAAEIRLYPPINPKTCVCTWTVWVWWNHVKILSDIASDISDISVICYYLVLDVIGYRYIFIGFGYIYNCCWLMVYICPTSWLMSSHNHLTEGTTNKGPLLMFKSLESLELTLSQGPRQNVVKHGTPSSKQQPTINNLGGA